MDTQKRSKTTQTQLTEIEKNIQTTNATIQSILDAIKNERETLTVTMHQSDLGNQQAFLITLQQKASTLRSTLKALNPN